MYLLYKNLPVSAQNLMCSLYGYLSEKKRKRTPASDIYIRCTISELEEYQRSRLRSHILSASKTQYWSNQFSRLGVDVCKDEPFDVLSKLPITSKSDVQGNEALFLNSDYAPSSLNEVATSGSTGAGLRFWETKSAEVERWSCWWRYRSINGISTNDLCAVFGGQKIVPIDIDKPPFFRMNRPSKQVLFSSYHLNEKNIQNYVDSLNKYQPPWIHGYPSVIYLLSKLAISKRIKLKYKPKIITFGSEGLLDYQTEVIRNFFKCRLVQHYGLAESVANISEYPDGKLRIDEDFSYVELIKIEGLEGTYKLVGTNWSNPAFPLLRYDTGDVVVSSNSGLIEGHYNGRVIDKIDGRIESIISLPSGKKIGRIAGIFKAYPEIKEAQLVQKKDFSVEIRIVAIKEFEKKLEKKLLASLDALFLNELPLSIVYLEQIDRTKSGKIRFVISEISF